MALAFAAFSVVGVYSWSKFSTSSAPVISFNNMKIAKLTYEGRTNDKTAISPDGKYIAYGLNSEGKQSLMVRQVGNQAGVVEIIPPVQVDYDAIEFSKDGNSIYYIAAKPKSGAELYEIPVLGGTPRKILEDVDSFAFSPDGKTIAFVRSRTSLMLADANGENQRLLAKSAPGEIRHLLDWRPDGKALVSSIYSSEGKSYLTEISASDGKETRLPTQPWIRITGTKWLSDGSGIIISGRDLETQFSQIWFVSYPGGETQRITNDLTSYFDVSITKDNKSIVATKEERLYNIWTVPDGKTENAKKITIEEGKDEGISGVTQNSDGKIVYTVRTAGKFDLWSVNDDGSENRQLTFNQGSNLLPIFSPDGKSIIFNSNRSGNDDLWEMKIDGTNPVALTNTPVEKEGYANSTPDGHWIAYQQIDAKNLATIWKLNLKTKQAIQITKTDSYKPLVSPDGKYFACEYVLEGTEHIAIIPIEGDKPIKIIDLPLFRNPKPVRWSGDGKSLIYIDKRTQVHNLWSQSIDGGKPKQLTFFESGQIATFALGKDGKTFILSRGNESSDVIMVSNFR